MTNKNSSKEPVFDMLCEVGLREYYKNFVENGLDNLYNLVIQMKTPLPITHLALKSIGIGDSVHRTKIIVTLEKLGFYENVRKSFDGFEEFLDELNLKGFHLGLCSYGFEDLQSFLDGVKNGRVNYFLLEEKIGMKKYGHRIRLLGMAYYLTRINNKKSDCQIM